MFMRSADVHRLAGMSGPCQFVPAFRLGGIAMGKVCAAALLCVACCLASMSSGYAATGLPIKLFLSTDGLALSSFPHRYALRQTVRVIRTEGSQQVAWTAISNQPWLTVTASGVTGGKLKVEASPKELAKNQFYLAQVTVSTSGGDFTDTETLNVGLWVGSSDPTTVTLSTNALTIAANPVEPFAYVANGGSSISEYNVYSGALVTTFQNVATNVGAMEVSSDGNTLFAADMSNNNIVALNASTGAQLGSYASGSTVDSWFNMAYARPYGQPAIYAMGGSIIAYPSGKVLAGGIPNNYYIAVTPDGRKLFAVDIGLSPSILAAFSFRARNGTFTLAPVASTTIQVANCQDLAVSRDGTRVYPACGSAGEFDVYNDKTLAQVQTLPGNAYPANIEVDVNDDAVGGLDASYLPDDVYVYNPQGFLVGEVPTLSPNASNTQQAAAMRVSGDGTRVVSVTYPIPDYPQTLMLRNMP